MSPEISAPKPSRATTARARDFCYDRGMNEAERTLACFLGAYAFTGVALGAAMVLGHKGRVRAHISLILVFLAGFVVTIYFADRTGTYFGFEPRAQSIHMPLAYAGTASALLPVTTGLLHWLKKGSLFLHRAAIGVFLLAFVAASATGGYMLTTRHPF
jgi:hypothetical protein